MRTTGITSVPDPDESGFLSPDPSVNKLLGSKLSFVLVKDEPDQIVRVQNMKYKKNTSTCNSVFGRFLRIRIFPDRIRIFVIDSHFLPQFLKNLFG